MVAVLALVSSLVAAASTVQAGVIPHHHRALTFARSAVPEGWITDIMEPYDEYHTRYMALDCEDQHDTAFFDLCCHPMKSNETLATARDASCDPANASTSVVLSATATVTSSSSAATNVASSDDDEDCDDEDDSGDDDEEDCDDDGETTSAVAATSTKAAATSKAAVTSKAAATTKAAATSKAAETTSAAAETTTSKAAASSAKPTTSAAAKPTTTSEAQATTTKKATSTKAASSAQATSTASSDDSGDFIEGGKATFFYQEGGTGSCGNKNSDSTLLVAVQEDRMNSSLCGKKVEIINTANGKSVEATVQDTCPGCANANSLDLSVAAFDAIGDEATGVLNIKWKFLD
ncbi:unnamed protein product [Peniophora sp. CBMAI 1063]|nr:unnamed protein product [Peniophora sp. CBMAI 1063]